MASLSQPLDRALTAPCCLLTPRIHALFVVGDERAGAWLADAFASDSASEVILEEAAGMAEGLRRLREEAFNAIFISHEDGLNSLSFLDALQGAGDDEQAIVVMGEPSEQEMAALCYEGGADAYICLRTTTTRALSWTVARAVERRHLLAENRRLVQSQRHRLQLEHNEATRLLEQQRELIADLDALRRDSPTSTSPPLSLSAEAVTRYRELLRAHVMMGSGNLADELSELGGLLTEAGVTAQQAMQFHLHVLEQLIAGLGNRSARHVMNRADMLILEVMMNLVEHYRLQARNSPPRQQLLPGFRQLEGDAA